METSVNNKIKVGIFITAGIILFVVTIFVIGSKTNLFTQTYMIKSEFETVGGLKHGSSVRLNGIIIGNVDDIYIISQNRVVVEMKLEKRIQDFVKADSKAKVSSEGLVGNKIVEIIPGSNNAPAAENNAMIQSVKPIEMEDIMNNLNQTSTSASKLIGDLSDVVAKVNNGEGTIGQLVTNDALYRNMDSTFRSFGSYSGKINTVVEEVIRSVRILSIDAEKFTETINNISSDVEEITETMKSGKSTAGKLLTDTVFANNLSDLIINANQVSKNLEQGSFAFSQNMEALKHNFFFKGYFEDVGYWDKDKTEDYINQKRKELEELEQKIRQKKSELEKIDK